MRYELGWMLVLVLISAWLWGGGVDWFRCVYISDAGVFLWVTIAWGV